jgi:hypothetical protein
MFGLVPALMIGREVLERIVAGLTVETRGDGELAAVAEQRVAVRDSLCSETRGDRAPGASSVVYDNGLA